MKTLIFSFLTIGLLLLSCKTKPLNYITYYNKVNTIDSVLRYQQDTLYAIKHYKKLFRKYPPKNQERILELETYIKLADKKNKNFGGKKTLQKLLPLIAPYGLTYKEHFDLYKKYGIDSLEVEKNIDNWRNALNKQLIDSFTIAMIRDQNHDYLDRNLHNLILKKNTNLFLWTFKNFGFPSLQKIGNKGYNDVFIAMPSLIDHMSQSEKYEILKNKFFEYVVKGEVSPVVYAAFIDKHKINFTKNTEKMLYGAYKTYDQNFDSIEINKNRKSIGLPSLKHAAKIRKDFISKIKEK